MAIILPFQWDSGNLKHMMDNHANGRPYYPQQLESVFNDPAAHFTTGSLHTGSMEQRLRVVGSDHSGSVLLVNHIIRDGQIRVVTSFRGQQKRVCCAITAFTLRQLPLHTRPEVLHQVQQDFSSAEPTPVCGAAAPA